MSLSSRYKSYSYDDDDDDDDDGDVVTDMAPVFVELTAVQDKALATLTSCEGKCMGSLADALVMFLTCPDSDPVVRD
ncbi:hypothetical protein C0Q70_10832 [Pomacea canaliculata]|uniref:Uncharacterized protein n=1 Tax=Pomacea canaliculata TaxID=400727 RepID=A0A2T7P493_POMCA|nr:hypothetical protein C0Q70_10832 [Pomacea canaliculata]